MNHQYIFHFHKLLHNQYVYIYLNNKINSLFNALSIASNILFFGNLYVPNPIIGILIPLFNCFNYKKINFNTIIII